MIGDVEYKRRFKKKNHTAIEQSAVKRVQAVAPKVLLSDTNLYINYTPFLKQETSHSNLTINNLSINA